MIVIELRSGVIQAVLADADFAKREDITAEIVDFDEIENDPNCGIEWADVETAEGESIYRKNGYVEISMEGCVRERV